MGTPLDPHAEHSVRCVLRRVIGGTKVARDVVPDWRGSADNGRRPLS